MKILTLFISLFLAITFQSCLNKETFPPEPSIAFVKLLTYPDSARLVLSFTDGDGNLGLNQEDTTGSYCDSCIFYHNLFCEYYELQNGVWVHIPLNPLPPFEQIPFYYRVPYLEPTGQNKTQQGEISIAMPFYFLESEFDTCKFEIQVVDRSFNYSNKIKTRVFTKPS